MIAPQGHNQVAIQLNPYGPIGCPPSFVSRGKKTFFFKTIERPLDCVLPKGKKPLKNNNL
jgi:hypothetical protein